MDENEQRLAEVERDLISFKKIPVFSVGVKANAAEAIIEKTVYLMRCMVADIKELKEGAKSGE